MRKFLLAAAAFSAIAGATAMAQNASPNNPGNGPAVDDKMNSPAPQGGAMGANPTPTAPANAPPGCHSSRAEGGAELYPAAEHGHVELERGRTRHL